jgi:hypothetical protein
MSPQTPSCLFFTVFLLVIVRFTPSHWSKMRSLWTLLLSVSFVSDRFRLWVVLWFVLAHCPLILSFHVCKSRVLLVFFGRRKKVHEQITYSLPLGNPGFRYPVIVDFVIKIMKWSLRSRKLFVKSPWSWSRTDHQIPVYNWWLVIQIMIRSWSDHHSVINNLKIDIPRDPVHDQIMNTWSDKFDHVDHDPLGDFRPMGFCIVLYRWDSLYGIIYVCYC